MRKNKKKIMQPEEGPVQADPSGTFRLLIISFAFLAMAVFAAYSNSLHGTWALDDTSISRQAAGIQDNINLRMGYRKVTHLSFLVNKWINPLDPFNYRVLNVAIHIVNSVLVYWLIFLTLRLPGMRGRFAGYSHPVALLTAALFALHPIQINAVAYIVQRMTSLSAMFVLLGLISYIYGRRLSFGLPAIALYLLSASFVFLGIFSKENAVLALPLMLLYDGFFIGGRQGKGFALKAAAGVAGILLVLAVASVYLDFSRAAGIIVRQFMNPNSPISPEGWTAVDVYWSPLQHIMTGFRVVCRYLFLLLLPLPGFLVFDRWGYQLSSGLTTPVSTLFSMLVIAGVLAAAVLRRKKIPFLSFGILWYFAAISLESFIGVGSDLYFEHRNYLPVAGLFFGIVAQVALSLKDTLLKPGPLWGAVVVLSVLLGGLTFQRNFVWKDSVTLWTDTVNKAPGNLRALMALGNSYLKGADFSSAAKYYGEAFKQSYDDRRPQFFHDSAYSLGMVHLFRGDLGRAKKIIDLMDDRLAGNPSTGILKGFYSSQSGDAETAIRQLNESLSGSSGLDSVIVHTLLGDTYRRTGNLSKAIGSYKKALELDPTFAAAWYGMGSAYFVIKDIANAEKFTGRALELDPLNPLALAQMADIVLIRKGPLDTALQLAEKAVASSPPFYQPYASMATVLVMMGKDDVAGTFFQKAGEHGLLGYQLPFARARAYYMRGDKKMAEVYLKEIAGMADAPAELKEMIRSKKGGL